MWWDFDTTKLVVWMCVGMFWALVLILVLVWLVG